MKKAILEIIFLGLAAVFTCVILFYASCNNDDCSDCPPLSNYELNFFCYNSGDKVVFKNDTTNIFDTLTIGTKYIMSTFCSSPCDNPNGYIEVDFSFSHLLKDGGMGIQAHNEIPKISFDGPSPTSYIFPLSGNTQTIIVNSTSYNDVYIVQIDSTGIDNNGDKQTVPWKIDYSKSKGFVRFYMVNGQTWSKL